MSEIASLSSPDWKSYAYLILNQTIGKLEKKGVDPEVVERIRQIKEKISNGVYAPSILQAQLESIKQEEGDLFEKVDNNAKDKITRLQKKLKFLVDFTITQIGYTKQRRKKNKKHFEVISLDDFVDLNPEYGSSNKLYHEIEDLFNDSYIGIADALGLPVIIDTNNTEEIMFKLTEELWRIYNEKNGFPSENRVFDTALELPVSTECHYSLNYYSRIFGSFSNAVEEVLIKAVKGPAIKAKCIKEEELWERYKKYGDLKARESLILRHQRMVHKLAHEVRRQGVLHEDKVHFGQLGLIKAVEGFEPERGYKFSTYAYQIIKQSIHRKIVETGTIIRLPDYINRILTKYHKLNYKSGGALDKIADPKKLSKIIDCSVGAAEQVMHLRGVGIPVHLDSPISGYENITYMEIIGKKDLGYKDMENYYYRKKLLELINERILPLVSSSQKVGHYGNDKLWTVFCLYFGFNDELRSYLDHDISHIVDIKIEQIKIIVALFKKQICQDDEIRKLLKDLVL